jgi:glycosyltransferase involved in cell wall biosynthesis
VEHKNSNWKKIIWRKILRRADLILAVSEQVEKFYGQKFSLPQKKMVVLRNGIELEDWFELKSGDILQKQELLLANIGRLEYQKGQDILLRALYKVRDLNWKMYIYGEGSWRERLKKMTTSLGLNGKVKFKGVSLNLPYEMPEIDVVIQPSRWEGNSLVIMEAMAAGRGIIASSPAAEGLLAAEKTGLVVKKEDAEALADAIRTVFIKKEKIRAMAGEAQNYARLHFSIESHMEKLKRIYDYV